MLTVDISNVWSRISFLDLMHFENEIFAAHNRVSDIPASGSPFPGCPDLSISQSPGEMLRLLSTAQKIRASSDILIVIGTPGTCLGSRAAIELLQGPSRNSSRAKGEPQLFFMGNSLSLRQWHELQQILSGRDFSICVISGSDEDRIPAIDFRNLRWLLERRYGTDESRKRISAVTPSGTALYRMAEEEGWETFLLPEGTAGCMSVLTPAGLLPMSVAGIDIASVLEGAAKASEELNLRSYDNPLWLYTAVRTLMLRRGVKAELLAAWEPGFEAMGRWWQQLFAETANQNCTGIFSVPVCFPEHRSTLDPLIQGCLPHLFETMIRFEPPIQSAVIVEDVVNYDGLNSLAGKSLDKLEDTLCCRTMDAHSDIGLPIVSIHCEGVNEDALGYLFYFLQLSCALSAQIPGSSVSDNS